MRLVDYDDNFVGSSTDTALVNNAEIWDCLENKLLTVAEISRKQLLVNPLDGGVYYQIKDGKFVRTARYIYTAV